MRDLSRAITILSVLFLAFSAKATDLPPVLINEIAWMGGEESFANEWIELYNNTNKAINLEGWILKAVDGVPEISLEGTIFARSFYLLERTDDETVPGIKADLIYKGSLSNKGECLELVNPQGETADEVDCSSGWFAGDNKTKQTMERLDSEKWQTSQNPKGTPKTKNSPGATSDYSPATDQETETKKDLTAADKQIPEKSSFFPSLAAFVLATFSGLIILSLKRKIKTS
jgi:hypothetical protein